MILESKIGANDLVVKEGLYGSVMMVEDKINLKLFLEDDRNTVALEDRENRYLVLNKLYLTKDIIAIYQDEYSRTPLFNPFNRVLQVSSTSTCKPSAEVV